MKTSSLTLSFAAFMHLIVIDSICFFLSSEIPMNLNIIAGYNILWVVLIILIGAQAYNHERA